MLLLLLGAIALVGCADGMGRGWGERSSEVSVILSDTGLLTFTGTSKWLVYTELEPAAMVDSPDTTSAARQEKCRHLDGNRYLMLVRNRT